MSVPWILSCQSLISLTDLEILAKQPVKELCSDLHRPTAALICTPIWGWWPWLPLCPSPAPEMGWTVVNISLVLRHSTLWPLMLHPSLPHTPDRSLLLSHFTSSVGFSLQTEGSSGATEKMKKGLSDFLGVISDTFAPSPDKTIDCDVITLMGTPSGTAEPYDGTKVFTSDPGL